MTRPSGPIDAEDSAASVVFPSELGTTKTKNAIQSARPDTPRTHPAARSGLEFSITEMQKAAATSNIRPMSSIVLAGILRLHARAQIARPSTVPAASAIFINGDDIAVENRFAGRLYVLVQ